MEEEGESSSPRYIYTVKIDITGEHVYRVNKTLTPYICILVHTRVFI